MNPETDLVDLEAVEPRQSADPLPLLKDGVKRIEPLRSAWLLWSFVAFGNFALFAAVVVGGFLLFPETPAVWITAGVVGLVAHCVFGAIKRGCEGKVRVAFDRWRADVFAFLERGAEFSAGGYMAASEFDNSGLNSAYYNRYSGSGYVQARGLTASNLAINHVYTKTEYYTDSNGNQGSRTVTVTDPVFHGILIVTDAPLPCRGTVVVNDPHHGIGTLRKVQVASPHLKKSYAVGADEPFTGHRVLTPSLQEALWEYRRGFKYLPRFAYRSGLLYVAIPGASLDAGTCPTRFSPVTIARLERVLVQCGELLAFLHASAERLRPETDD